MVPRGSREHLVQYWSACHHVTGHLCLQHGVRIFLKKRPGKEFGLEASSYQEVLNPEFLPLSSACAEAPAGYSSKNTTNRKIESARGRWEEGTGGSSILSFPFPSCRAPSFLPSPPTTQRGLRGERVLTRALKRRCQD